MKQLPVLAAILALASAAPLHAVPGGKLGVLAKGQYVCELPGSAGSVSRIHVPEEDFKIVNASSYVVNGQRGTYLLLGDDAVMTSGLFEGKRFHRETDGYVRKIAKDGSVGPMRCVRETR